jgi:hypothetical protein
MNRRQALNCRAFTGAFNLPPTVLSSLPERRLLLPQRLNMVTAKRSGIVVCLQSSLRYFDSEVWRLLFSLTSTYQADLVIPKVHRSNLAAETRYSVHHRWKRWERETLATSYLYVIRKVPCFLFELGRYDVICNLRALPNTTPSVFLQPLYLHLIPETPLHHRDT